MLTDPYFLGLLLAGWTVIGAVAWFLLKHQMDNLRSDVTTAQTETALAKQEAALAKEQAVAATRAASGAVSTVATAVDAVDATHQVARELIAAIAKMFLWESEAGKHMGIGPLQSAKRGEIIQQLLTNAALTEKEMADVRSVSLPFIRWRYADYVTQAVSHVNWSPEQSKAWNEFFSGDLRRGIGFEPSPQQLREFVEAHGFLNPELDERLKDYASWETSQQHRRRAVWDEYARQW